MDDLAVWFKRKWHGKTAPAAKISG
jgi:hypothetical protein